MPFGKLNQIDPVFEDLNIIVIKMKLLHEHFSQYNAAPAMTFRVKRNTKLIFYNNETRRASLLS